MREKNRSYEEMTHIYGRIWILSALGMIFAYPIAACIYYDAWPGIVPVLKGLVGVAPIFWTVGLIEVLTFVPMLGTAGSYLAFVTGNLTNLKVPAALTAMENARVKPGSEEGEVISTIAVATSSIVTTVIIAVGVALLVPLTPILNSPTLKPAFDNILPALFGGLATFFIYGGIMNPASVLMFQSDPTWEMIISSYALGMPMDLVHAASTFFFLLVISRPFLAKLDRLKSKYGLLQQPAAAG